VEVTIGATLWGLFSCFLLFPHLGLPVAMQRTAAALLAAEFVLLLVWRYGSEGCTERPCAPVAETARTAIAIDVPALGALLVAAAVVYGVRHSSRA
jgi:hypothetical protein